MKKLVSRYVEVRPEIFLAIGEGLGDVVAEFQFQRIGTDHEGSAEIRFPGFEYRAKIQEDDVVVTDDQVGRILIVRRERVTASAHDALVPVGGVAEQFFGGPL